MRRVPGRVRLEHGTRDVLGSDVSRNSLTSLPVGLLDHTPALQFL